MGEPAASTGGTPRRWPSRRCSPTASACASPARTPSAARSRIATRCCTTWRRATTYTPLASTCPTRRARFEIYNSPLSETAVMGFEYGFSTAAPDDARAVGGAVRRLRERRAADHRPVHLAGSREVGTDAAGSCCCCRTATRGTGRSTRARGSSGSSSSCAEDNMIVAYPSHAGAVLPRAAASGGCAATGRRWC